ncbi:ribosomal protein S18 [Xylariaceae sp. FL0662B]|nr:ribosomal protein S18 [Xylariaceae sp. FL0662B]
MPPRIPILGALRRPSTLMRAQTANISSTRASQALRKDVPSATSSLLDVDQSSGNGNGQAATADPTRTASNLYDRLGGARRRQELDQELQQRETSEDYARQMTRRWRVGDVYAPHDLSPIEMGKWRRNQARQRDLVDLLGLRPLDMYKNFSVIAEFTTSHGKIKRPADTGLRPPNQRKMAKAIRRAIGLGLYPSVHRHPEILYRENDRLTAQSMATVNKELKW